MYDANLFPKKSPNITIQIPSETEKENYGQYELSKLVDLKFEDVPPLNDLLIVYSVDDMDTHLNPNASWFAYFSKCLVDVEKALKPSKEVYDLIMMKEQTKLDRKDFKTVDEFRNKAILNGEDAYLKINKRITDLEASVSTLKFIIKAFEMKSDNLIGLSASIRKAKETPYLPEEMITHKIKEIFDMYTKKQMKYLGGENV